MGTATFAIGQLPYMDDGTVGTPPVRPATSAVPEASPPGPEETIVLVRRAREGDEAAIDTLFERYSARLKRWAHGRLPPRARGAHETQDLVQDVLQRVFKRLPCFDPRHPGAFRDYVWTTLWHCVYDLARKYKNQGQSVPVDDQEIVAGTLSPLEMAIGAESLECYRAAMDRLRPDEREAIVMRIELGLSHAEIAKALGKPSAAAAHMFVRRALVRLAKEMADVRDQRRRS